MVDVCQNAPWDHSALTDQSRASLPLRLRSHCITVLHACEMFFPRVDGTRRLDQASGSS